VTKTFDVAVVGATTVVGELMVELLAERDFPLNGLSLLDSAEAVGKRLEFRNRQVAVKDLAGFDFSTVQLALFAVDAGLAARFAPEAAAAGCVVIDSSTQYRLDDQVPLVIPEVNPEALAEYARRRIIASPGSAAIQLLLALKPLHDAAGLVRLNLATYQSVSGSGRSGIKELAEQTANLLNARSLEQRVYPKQIAFNALPQVDEIQANGYSADEQQLVDEIHKILGEPQLGINPTTVRIPVFFGDSQAVHLETRDKLSAEQARRLLQQAPGVKVLQSRAVDGYPTAVSEAVNSDAVYVGRIREDQSHPRGLDLWIVADNIRKGAALNGVQIAEILVKDYL
jgi:aspartate-semialdehyde dehydrogenase